MAEKNSPTPNPDIVRDRATSSISDLWKKEDYWAIWLGFTILVIGLLIFMPQKPEGMTEKLAKANATLKAESERAPFKTVAWYKAVDAKKKLKATDSSIGKKIKVFTSKPHGWKTNPADSFVKSEAVANAANEKGQPKYEAAKAKEEEALAAAQAAEALAADAGFQDAALNSAAVKAIDDWRSAHNKTSSAKKKIGAKPYNQIPYLIGLMIVMGVFFGIGMAVMGKSFGKFLVGFVFVFFIATLAYMAEGQSTSKEYGIGYAAWAILFGLIISNTVGTPKWVMPAVQTEYYIKTGLVLLGAEILFGKIISIGIPGIFVAWVVTPIVLITTYIFGQKVVKDPVKNPEHHHFSRHVGVRGFGRHRHRSGLQGQEGRADPGRGPVPGFHLDHDDRHAGFHQSRGHAPCTGRRLDGRHHRCHRCGRRCRRFLE